MKQVNEFRSNIKVVAAFSGGLDSILAGVHMARLGFAVTFLHVQHLFSANEEGRKRLAETAEKVGIPLRIVDASSGHLETIRRPKHGYGVGMNPCVDCRIFMLKVAKQVMEEMGAAFVVTGEVMGQRPKSQHHKALLEAAEESGLGDRLVRPLCANLLPDTYPVTQGWISHDELFDIQGRQRQRQMALAAEYGVVDYPQPAGGCVLIEKPYAARVRDAFDHLGRDNVGVDEFTLLRLGRHFRISERAKVIVGHNHAENLAIAEFAGGRWKIDPLDVMGPTALVEGEPTDAEIVLAASLVARYCDHGGRTSLPMIIVHDRSERVLDVAPLAKDDPRIVSWRLGT